MIAISAVEGASRVLRGNTLGIKAGCALSKRASSGPTRLDPATLSPGEAWCRSQESGGIWIDKFRFTIYYFGAARDNYEVRNEDYGFCSIYGEAFQPSRLASTRHATRQVLCWGKMRKRALAS